MKLVVGLGNPGVRYAWTRHNAGWHVLDLLRSRLSSRERSVLESILWGPSSVSGEQVFLLKPMTYMNLSGVAVKRAFRSLDLGLDDILVIYDDIALPFGRIRLRAQGSAGGHKGMISIIAHLGSLEFPRLRIGIEGEDPRRDLSDYVTGSFLLLKWPPCQEYVKGVRMWCSSGYPRYRRGDEAGQFTSWRGRLIVSPGRSRKNPLPPANP